jgi:hypothetical protein
VASSSCQRELSAVVNFRIFGCERAACCAGEWKISKITGVSNGQPVLQRCSVSFRVS